MTAASAQNRKCYGQFCPMATALDVIGDRWTILILRELLGGAARFQDLHAGLPGIAKNLLTQRLRRLESDGILERVRSQGVVLYTLTAQGVPAGALQRSADLYDDPQYKHRGFHRFLQHPEMGRVPYAGNQFTIAGYQPGPHRPAPLLGEHSFEVMHDLLGMSDEEIGAAFATDAIR